MADLWLPGIAGPHDDFVERIHRGIARFAERQGIAQAVVVVELVGGSRFTVDSISPDPGFGFVTISPHPEEDAPGELILPIGAIGRIELHVAEEEEPRLGFSLPDTTQHETG